jgi:hypothetical protein
MELTEIYKLVRDKYQEGIEIHGNNYSRGICSVVQLLEDNEVLDRYDSLMFYSHFEKQKPAFTRHREFYDEPHYSGKVYWWYSDKGEASNASRLRFLDKMIEITKTEPYVKDEY